MVGESGSGKSLTALAVARLLEQPGAGVRRGPARRSSAQDLRGGGRAAGAMTGRELRRFLGITPGWCSRTR